MTFSGKVHIPTNIKKRKEIIFIMSEIPHKLVGMIMDDA